MAVLVPAERHVPGVNQRAHRRKSCSAQPLGSKQVPRRASRGAACVCAWVVAMVKANSTPEAVIALANRDEAPVGINSSPTHSG